MQNKTPIQPEVPLKGLEIWACEWEDAHWNSGEFESHEITHRPVNYVTVGINLFNDETGISLATDICEAGTFRGINFVPRKMIVRQWKVGTLKPSNRRNPSVPKDPRRAEASLTTSNKQPSEPD